MRGVRSIVVSMALAGCAVFGCAERISPGSDVQTAVHSCSASTDCAAGEVCVFVLGCPSPSAHCERDPGPTTGLPAVPYCGCDGVTRFEVTGPQHPSRSDGRCPMSDAMVDAPSADIEDVSADRPCPPGTCHYYSGDPMCRAPGGPISGCCACGDNGECSAQCMCASPDTPIATPEGERPIASLHVGDLVDSIDHGKRVAVALLRVNRTPVTHHRVVRVRLASGAVLHISAGHPTADGRTFGALRSGDWLGGERVEEVSIEAYPHEATFDVLPDSDTGAYFAAGALIGSTLAPRVALRVESDVCWAAVAVQHND